jgi:arylsulfatase A-like enzyme
MRFIVIVLDGLRPDLLTPAAMPNVARLLAGGTRFANGRSVFPSETRVCTSSLATGCRPGTHGLTGNTLFDAAIAPDRLLRTASRADLALLARGAESPLDRPTLGEHLAAAGRSLAVVSGGTAGSAFLLHPLAERLGAFRWNVNDNEGAAAERLRARLGRTPAHAVPNLARVEFIARVMTEIALPEVCADVTLLWCPEPDISCHYRGIGSEVTQGQALRAADALVGRIAAWRDAQPDAAEIGLVLLSDHGMVTGPRRISVSEELSRAGIRAGSGFAEGIEVVVAPAAAPGLWLRDPSMARQVVEALTSQGWAGPVLARDPAALGLEGRVMPLSLLDAAHPRAPDLTLTFAGEEGPDAYGLPGTAPFDATDVGEGGGMHGGLHRRELATLMAMQGGPFRRGAVVQGAADLSDIAPTLLHLLGVEAAGMQGRVLRAAWDAAADEPPEEADLTLPGGFILERLRSESRVYPTGVRRVET